MYTMKLDYVKWYDLLCKTTHFAHDTVTHFKHDTDKYKTKQKSKILITNLNLLIIYNDYRNILTFVNRFF